jgi:aminoglycoside phosphotransferase (APT) family kinase protein
MVADKLLPYLQQTLFHNVPMEMTSISQVNSGWENDVYAFAVKTQNTHTQEYILRIYQGIGAASKALREYQGIQRLRAAGYPVPEIYAVEYDESILGKPFVIMEKIHGVTLADALGLATPSERQALLSAFCQLFVNLHNLEWPPFVADGSIYRNSPYASVDRFITELSQITHKFGVTEVEPALDWLRQHRNEVPCDNPSVIHWDFHPENVLVRADRALFVIDWTQIEVSDARFDLAWTLLVGTGESEPLRRIILQEYERLSGSTRRVEHLAFFEAAALLKRLLTMVISLRHGAESLGMRADADALIRSNVDQLHALCNRLSEVTGLPLCEVKLGA